MATSAQPPPSLDGEAEAEAEDADCAERDPAALLAEFVSVSLTSLASGDRRPYETLLTQLSAAFRTPDAAACARWLVALGTCTSRIALAPERCAALLRLLLAVPLRSLANSCVQSYADFLVGYATSAARGQRSAVEAVTAHLITAFAPPAAPNTFPGTGEAESAHEQQQAEAAQLQDIVHAALQRSVQRCSRRAAVA